MEIEINKKLIRKGISKEVYFVIDKKFVNNILHYIIKSKNSGDIILSKFAIEKDFILSFNLSDIISKNDIYLEYQGCFKNSFCYRKKEEKISY